MCAKVGCILVVEDEPMLTEFIADFVHDSLHCTVMTATSNRAALKCLQFERPDMAIVDYLVGDGLVEPTVIRLMGMGIPFFIVSGFSKSTAVGDIWPRLEWLEKPFSEVEFAAMFNLCCKQMKKVECSDPRDTAAPLVDKCPSCDLI